MGAEFFWTSLRAELPKGLFQRRAPRRFDFLVNISRRRRQDPPLKIAQGASFAELV